MEFQCNFFFIETCCDRNLSEEDGEWQNCLWDASNVLMPAKLKQLFFFFLGGGGQQNITFGTKFKSSLCVNLVKPTSILYPRSFLQFNNVSIHGFFFSNVVMVAKSPDTLLNSVGSLPLR